MVVLWLDFVLVVLETLSVFLLIWGAVKVCVATIAYLTFESDKLTYMNPLLLTLQRIAVLLLPWLAMELATTLYDLGFFAYLFLSDVYIAIDLLPIILLREYKDEISFEIWAAL